MKMPPKAVKRIRNARCRSSDSSKTETVSASARPVQSVVKANLNRGFPAELAT
jgi:hypothetical protein